MRIYVHNSCDDGHDGSAAFVCSYDCDVLAVLYVLRCTQWCSLTAIRTGATKCGAWAILERSAIAPLACTCLRLATGRRVRVEYIFVLHTVRVLDI